MSLTEREQELSRQAEEITLFLESPEGRDLLLNLRLDGKVLNIQEKTITDKGVFVSYLLTGTGLVEISLCLQTGECLDIISHTPHKFLQAIQQTSGFSPLQEMRKSFNPMETV